MIIDWKVWKRSGRRAKPTAYWSSQEYNNRCYTRCGPKCEAIQTNQGKCHRFEGWGVIFHASNSSSQGPPPEIQSLIQTDWSQYSKNREESTWVQMWNILTTCTGGPNPPNCKSTFSKTGRKRWSFSISPLKRKDKIYITRKESMIQVDRKMIIFH